VPSSSRARFASTELALASAAELAQWTLGVALPDPARFGVVAGAGVAAVAGAAVGYAAWVRWWRGHLVHVRVHVGCCCGGGKG